MEGLAPLGDRTEVISNVAGEFLPRGRLGQGYQSHTWAINVDYLEETDSKRIVSGCDLKSILCSYPTRKGSLTFRKSYH